MSRDHFPARADGVQSITTARASHSDEMRTRMIKYAVAMGIRLVCFGLLFVVDGWWKILPIVGAVFIPWFAVIIANGGSDTREPESNALLDHAPQAELETPPTSPAGQDTGATDSHSGEPVTLQGEVVPEENGDAEQLRNTEHGRE